MTRPRLLDLCCGAGPGADGYTLAGFHVEGIDNRPQPDYPYPFHLGDALDALRGGAWRTYDAIHVSPPCQAHTRAQHLRTAQGGTSRYADLLTPVLAELARVPRPWIVENVPGAPGMENAITLCGSSFGLQVRRHRLFLSSVALWSLPCNHPAQGRPWGVYHVPADTIPDGGRTCTDATHAAQCLGVERPVPWAGLKECIPPAYTEFVGRQILAHL